MKAAIVEKAGALVVRDAPDPRPGDYEALCAQLFGATCTGTDTHLIRGEFPFPIRYPAILGHESVGRVVEVGRKVRNFRVGDLVTRVGAPPAADGSYDICWGGVASMGLARDHWAMRADGPPEAEWMGSRVNQIIPPGVSPQEAPMFTTWRETLSYLLRIGVGAGWSVLVVGSGGNGLSFAAHAVRLGAQAVWQVGSARCEQAARSVGVTGFLDYHREDCVPTLRDACPTGFDLIIDALGKVGVADRFLGLLAVGGRLGIYGLDDFQRVAISPRLARGSFTVCNSGYDESETHQRVSEMALQGLLSARAWYDPARPYPLMRINDAFADLWNRKAVKALIQLSS